MELTEYTKKSASHCIYQSIAHTVTDAPDPIVMGSPNPITKY